MVHVGDLGFILWEIDIDKCHSQDEFFQRHPELMTPAAGQILPTICHFMDQTQTRECSTMNLILVSMFVIPRRWVLYQVFKLERSAPNQLVTSCR
jgi:hypothetical protein